MIGKLLMTEGREAIERWCRGRATAIALPDGNTLCRVLGEYPMVLTMKDISVAPHLALDGYWEIWNAMCIAKRIKPGWHCIDVGANFGYYTLLLAELVGKEGSVEAWEPAADLVARLTRTLRLNGLTDRVKLIERAAGGAEEARVLVRSRTDDFGSGSVRPEWGSGDGDAFAVNMTRLDETALGRVDFVKVDVEGHEPEVWAGMEKLLARGEPRSMLLEWTPSKYPDAGTFLESIKAAGFSVGVVNADGDVKPPEGDITKIEKHLDLYLSRETR